MMVWAVFSIIKALHRKPTKSPRLVSYNNQRQQAAKRLVAKQTAKQLANMSAPRWMMEGEFEPEGYAYEEDYNSNENEKFYTEYDDGVCTICMGGSFVRRIYIQDNYYEEEEDYDY